MSLMMRSSVTSCFAIVSIVLPSRMTVTESATFLISFSLWLMMIDVMPCPLRCRIRSSRWSESSSLSAAVGSSRMRSFTSFESAFAISTSCCLPTPMSMIFVVGFSRRPTRARSFDASKFVLFQSIRPPRPFSSLLRKMFSAIDRYGLSASSWWMMTMPLASLSVRSRNSTVSFSKTMSPS